MARYVRESGEVELLKETVEGVRNKRRVHGVLILTDRRLVVQIARPSPLLGWLVGLVSPLYHPAAADAGPLEMTHQIDRAKLDSVEAHDRQMIAFHTKGEGHGQTSFAVYSMTPFDVWQLRIQQWLAGTLAAAPLPQARLVER
ncbi:MAG TPA: hypothetical protein VHW23_37210 [Kofleriaceae bacterium]|jgi:hypothetical protein|nr:hypothetical protein [Kofleriaceae bacterium]